MGIEVTVVEDGKEAVEKALGQSFDLIFMDIQMPVMNGHEATMVLKQEGLTTPIVALTASATKGTGQPLNLDLQIQQRIHIYYSQYLLLLEWTVLTGNLNPQNRLLEMYLI